jgi:hypothetical protein
MKRPGSRSWQEARRAIGCVLAGCILVGQGAFPSLAEAQPLTHLGQPAGRHVTLWFVEGAPAGSVCPGGSGRASGEQLFRVFPNGDMADEPFAVPFFNVLVVTDVEWRVRYTAGLRTGPSLHLNIGLATSPSRSQTVFLSRPVAINGDTHNWVGSSEQLTAGFLVGPGAQICARAQILGGTFGAGDTDPISISDLVLRGYLAPNQPGIDFTPPGPRRSP